MPTLAYNYLHEDAFDGSLLLLPTLHKAIWAYIVAKAKPDAKAVGGGAVSLVPRLMQVYFSDVTLRDIEKVIQQFCQPDPETRTEVHQGRKLIPMGRDKYAIPTYSTHAGSRLARDAERKRREREGHNGHERGTPLILSSLQVERLRETHAFVGSRLRVPNVLHEELRNKLGAEGEVKLQEWYHQLDADVEQSGEAIPDIFDWLRPRFADWCITSGIVKPFQKSSRKKQPVDLAQIEREVNAEKAARRR